MPLPLLLPLGEGKIVGVLLAVFDGALLGTLVGLTETVLLPVGPFEGAVDGKRLGTFEG